MARFPEGRQRGIVTDCNDHDPAIHPGAVRSRRRIDNNSTPRRTQIRLPEAQDLQQLRRHTATGSATCWR